MTDSPRSSNDQCVVQCSWIDACTGRRCVLHQGHAATGVQGGHDVYGLDTSDLTPEQEIDRLVAARTGPGRPMVQRPNEAPTRPSCASCAGPAPGKYCTSCVMSGRASAHDRQELTDEIERLRVVIKTGGAMYRAERLALECGMGGMPPDEPRTQEATLCSPTDEYEKRAAMWLDRMTTTKRHDNVNYETLGALLAEVVAEHRPDNPQRDAKMPGLDPEHCATCRAFVERNAPPKPPVEVKNELWDAAILKVRQLEAEIKKSGASDREKSNMLHTHSKLWMFATDAWEQEVIRPAQKRAPRVDYPTVTELLDVLRRIAKYSTDPLVAADAATAVRQVESRSDSAKGGGE